MDSFKAADVVAKTLANAGAPLTEDQSLLLAGSLAVCLQAAVNAEREEAAARVAELTDALRHVLEFQSAPDGPTIHNWGRWRRIADGLRA